MEACTKGARLTAPVGGGEAHVDAGVTQAVLDAQVQRPVPPRLRKKPVRHHHSVGLGLDYAPTMPAGQPVNGIAPLRLGYRQLVIASREAVAAASRSVGPR